MKLLKIALAIAVLFVNLTLAQPSWADRPKFSKNPDYIEVTKTIQELKKSAEGTIPADVQRQIDELEFQKAAIESGTAWGQCRNESGGNLAIYGTGSEESGNSNQLYFLANKQTTPDQWDCQGVYLPADVKVTGLDKTGAVAVKIMDGTQLLVKKNPDTSELELNLPNAKIVKPGETDWFIPNVSQAFLDSRIPNTLTAAEND
ncbi:MAG: hypothetical protein KME49_21770 [Brasilonema octagenarum HA4186-MV1]|jgi:hypothetical protein|uniref:Uncharacterized protein n=2 Tax=Brasilonema TaxID=383614 RepID=A0A856MFV0_9CYAN|nr:MULTISPECIES: hypothetical protein [Brasilonema]MBW4628064.1 hypothetical protein [Brasilonema octagenarum HA4186-MV1]NMF62988.1 hypothetical protein [Brasilonema octagenarum UFV-OR1]QDL08561.1 hypothetical protein DP114_12260 [Brasilonema sennae CENA114]QDL14917.1 hypothetical protein DP113_12195 [Brasilonema octagenarum UFV-E1]